MEVNMHSFNKKYFFIYIYIYLHNTITSTKISIVSRGKTGQDLLKKNTLCFLKAKKIIFSLALEANIQSNPKKFGLKKLAYWLRNGGGMYPHP